MKTEEQTIIDTTPEKLVSDVKGYFDKGYRLIQIGCGRYGDVFEINYSFDKDYKFENLRLTIGEDVKVPSVSGVYLCAFIYENEIHDLYGIEITDIAVDYKGNLIKTSVKNPFREPAVTVTKVKKAVSKDAEPAKEGA